MAELSLTINQLSDDAQKNATRAFITFYLDLFKLGNLDVIVNQDHDAIIVSINHFILTNRNFKHDDLVARLLENRYPEFYQLLMEIHQTYNPDGRLTVGSWNQWLSQKEATIDTAEALS
ncbi:hypothetical protein ACFQ5M_00115 [Agrilactobacillus yilanensis]|uniref:Uncharacterized protein n=1 Tax=Agrilactobacillus yilanensis TaxID=2485997 RepID=A0ABW4J4C6_9LACO|nr:hypothetical protein [Agrilactobacillus yilanensis]